MNYRDISHFFSLYICNIHTSVVCMYHCRNLRVKMSSDTLPPPPEKGIVVSSLSLSLSLSVCIYNECKTWSLFFY